MTIALYGIPVGGGIALGRAHLLPQSMRDIPHYELSTKEERNNEIKRFKTAIKNTRRQLEQINKNLPTDSPTELGVFIQLHLMLLLDDSISSDPIDIIKEENVNAEWALHLQSQKLSAQFETIEDEYLRERKADILQVIERVFKNLRGDSMDFSSIQVDLFDDTILIASDFSPADAISFKDARIAAFLTDSGGPSSHTAILGRSLDIPSIVALHHALEVIHENEWVIVDGIDGVVIIDPDQRILEEYQKRAREYKAKKRTLNKLRNTSAITQDGVEIEILANIETVDDIALANKNMADGVGLFRSEFLFLNRDTPPDENEQYQYYSKILKKAAGKPVIMRTADLGADKALRKAESSIVINPALSLTGVRFSLAEPLMFRTQLRALLRAGVHGNISIMFPMIASIAEIKQCLSHLQIAKEQLIERNEVFAENVPIGIMVETPAAALMVGSLMKQVDFISVGTNDLIQYTLATDRNDETVAYLYQPTHPAVLKLLVHIIRTATRLHKPVSVCGEIAGNPNLTRMLLAIGLRRFSMHPSNILAVKEMILSSNVSLLESKIIPLLRNEDDERAREILDKLNQREESV